MYNTNSNKLIPYIKAYTLAELLVVLLLSALLIALGWGVLWVAQGQLDSYNKVSTANINLLAAERVWQQDAAVCKTAQCHNQMLGLDLGNGQLVYYHIDTDNTWLRSTEEHTDTLAKSVQLWELFFHRHLVNDLNTPVDSACITLVQSTENTALLKWGVKF